MTNIAVMSIFVPLLALSIQDLYNDLALRHIASDILREIKYSPLCDKYTIAKKLLQDSNAESTSAPQIAKQKLYTAHMILEGLYKKGYDNPYAHLLYGQTALSLGWEGKAENIFSTLLQTSKINPYYWFGYALYSYSLNDFEEASRAAHKAKRFNKNDSSLKIEIQALEDSIHCKRTGYFPNHTAE